MFRTRNCDACSLLQWFFSKSRKSDENLNLFTFKIIQHWILIYLHRSAIRFDFADCKYLHRTIFNVIRTKKNSRNEWFLNVADGTSFVEKSIQIQTVISLSEGNVDSSLEILFVFAVQLFELPSKSHSAWTIVEHWSQLSKVIGFDWN